MYAGTIASQHSYSHSVSKNANPILLDLSLFLMKSF